MLHQSDDGRSLALEGLDFIGDLSDEQLSSIISFLDTLLAPDIRNFLNEVCHSGIPH